MKIKSLSSHQRPSGNQTVRYKVAGNTTEIFYTSARRPKGCAIRKISKDQYIKTETDEVFMSKHIANRAGNPATMRKAMNKLRDLINTNVRDPTHCRWITLTYANNMTDSEQLGKDFACFIKKMHRRYGDFEYIVTPEPQVRGAWHSHVILIFPSKAPFISNQDLAAIWGNGFVSVKSIYNITNLGLYLTAHLGDLEYDEALELARGDIQKLRGHKIKDVEVLQDDGRKIPKRIVKGARLCLYPPQFHFYRCSKGIKKPIIEYIPASEAEERVSGATLTHESTIQLSNDESGFQAVMNYQHYNTIKP